MSAEEKRIEPGRWYWLEGVRDPVYVHDVDSERGVAHYRQPIPARKAWIGGRCVPIVLHPIVPSDGVSLEEQRLDALIEDVIGLHDPCNGPLAPRRAELIPDAYKIWVAAKQGVRLETVVLVEADETGDVFTFGRDARVVLRVYGTGPVIRYGTMSTPTMVFNYLRIRPGYRFPVTHTLNRAWTEYRLIKLEGESDG